MNLSSIQLSTSYHIKYFHTFAIRRFGFRQYSNINQPVIFYGCYDEVDYQRILEHRGLKAIIWGGTDSTLPIARNVCKISGLIHFAQSNYIIRDLQKQGIRNPIYLPFAPTVDEKRFYPIVKGNSIYIYTNAKNPNTYGVNLYTKIMREFPHIRFFVMSNISGIIEARKRRMDVSGIQSVDNSQILNIYQQCFLGIRFTKHDGISATVQELGLMGIPTICNGNTPSCINYRNEEDIIKIINIEMKKIGSVDIELSKNVSEHLNQTWDIIMNVFNIKIERQLIKEIEREIEREIEKVKVIIMKKWEWREEWNNEKELFVFDLTEDIKKGEKYTRGGNIKYFKISKIHGDKFIEKYIEKYIKGKEVYLEIIS